MISTLKPLLLKLSSFAQKRMGFSHPPKLFLKTDKENSSDVFGRTAHYDPEGKSVTIFIHGRHPKDILRSFAHELVHHTQNLRGDLSPEKCGKMTKTYAQDNNHLRNMEKEAYLVGNLCFRDWEDSCKMNLTESRLLKENKKMSNKITKQDIIHLIRDIISEQSKTDRPDRVAGRDAGGRRLDEDDDETNEEENNLEELEEMADTSAKDSSAKDSGCPKCGAPSKRTDEGMEVCSASNSPITYKRGSQKRSSACNKKPKANESLHSKKTPEEFSALNENRFGKRNSDLFERLTKKWTK